MHDRELIVVSYSRKLNGQDARAWLDEQLSARTRRHARARSVVLTDAADVHPALRAAGHDAIVRFADDGFRHVNDEATPERWDLPVSRSVDEQQKDGSPVSEPEKNRARAAAISEAAAKAHATGWGVRYVVLAHAHDDPNTESCSHVQRLAGAAGSALSWMPAPYLPNESQTSDTVVWLDTETTGLNPSRHAVIEFAAILTDATCRRVLATIERRIRIPAWAEVHPVALEKNGYHARSWEDAIDPRPAFAQLRAWLPASFTLAGHNVAFDRSFLTAEFERHELSAPGWRSTHCDTVLIARRRFQRTGRAQSCSLDSLRAHYSIETGRAHTAMTDAETSRQLYLRMLGKA